MHVSIIVELEKIGRLLGGDDPFSVRDCCKHPDIALFGGFKAENGGNIATAIAVIRC